MHTRDTVVWVRGVPRCAKIHYRTRAEPYISQGDGNGEGGGNLGGRL
jgi:hypothetical protein